MLIPLKNRVIKKYKVDVKANPDIAKKKDKPAEYKKDLFDILFDLPVPKTNKKAR